MKKLANVAIIVAAGNSTRMKADKSKLLLNLLGKTVIERTVDIFDQLNEFDKIIVVCRQCDLNTFQDIINSKKVSFAIGGKTRQESVQNAFDKISDDECDFVAIHDGARPLVTKGVVVKTLLQAKESLAAATGVFVKDTIKVVNEHNQIVDTPDRSKLVAIQTPQIFDYNLYLSAANQAKNQHKDFTDDCKLIENIGKKVVVVNGDYSNIKITTPDDIPLAENLLKIRGEKL